MPRLVFMGERRTVVPVRDDDGLRFVTVEPGQAVELSDDEVARYAWSAPGRFVEPDAVDDERLRRKRLARRRVA